MTNSRIDRKTLGVGSAALVVVFFVATGCAHTPIPAEAQEAYFQCSGTSLNEAQRHLASEGWPIASASEYQVTTDWRPIQLSTGAAIATGGSRYVIRLQVSEERGSARFRVYQALGGSTVGLQGSASREAEWNQILEAQVSDTEARRQLNLFRKSVCGDRDYFSGEERFIRH